MRMRISRFVFALTCVALCGICPDAKAVVDVSGSLWEARWQLEPGEAFAFQCTDTTHEPGKCAAAGFNNGEDKIIFYQSYESKWGHVIWSCQNGYECVNNDNGNKCVRGDGSAECSEGSVYLHLSRRCKGITANFEQCWLCSTLDNWETWDHKNMTCGVPVDALPDVGASDGAQETGDNTTQPVSESPSGNDGEGQDVSTFEAGPSLLCDTNLKDDMQPGQVKVVDCTKPEYKNACYDNTKSQAIYIGYDNKCHEAEIGCMSGYKCAIDIYTYFCIPGDGNPICPASYIFEDMCEGLENAALQAACEECFNTDWKAWDYKNKACSGGINDDIKQIVSDLNNISGGFGKSRWKTASGGFNTARLASDSIAGVVLGTVGGVVTSSIIKKNQVKGGFQDLQCAISGQVVAEYGDEFVIGRQYNQ